MSSFIPSSTSAHPVASFLPPSLTTTFVPPPECTQNHLTILEDQAYNIRRNEPVPVPNSTITSCYPSQFGNSWLLSAAGTSLPAFSPLVCPDSYYTAYNGTGGYIACCPSGYGLAAATPLDPNRFAYQASCFSDITAAIEVTAYDNSTFIGSSTLSFSTGSPQAFAYVIDGYSLTSSESSTITATTTPFSTTAMASSPAQSTASTSPIPTAHSSSLSSGAIAGIVIASVAAFLLLCTALFLFNRNHRLRAMLKQTSGAMLSREMVNMNEVDGANKVVELHGNTTRLELHGESTPSSPGWGEVKK